MSAPEEIVCETVEAFLDTCAAHWAATDWPYIKPGQVTMGRIPVRIVYRPPPPRDEAREAFEKWLSYDKEQHGIWDTAGMYRAFLAGRASVKP